METSLLFLLSVIIITVGYFITLVTFSIEDFIDIVLLSLLLVVDCMPYG